MKKVVCFGLCFLIVLCSFVISFADVEWYNGSGNPDILPTSPSAISFVFTNDTNISYSSNDDLVYIVFYKLSGQNGTFSLFFSDSPDALAYAKSQFGESTFNLTSEYNGFYYSTRASSSDLRNTDNYLINVTSPTDVIDFVNNTVFKTSFELSSIVDGSVSWVSSMAQAVKNNGLLLFFVLVCFVGIGIGLFRRFVNG